ncbi:hypothetical protein DPMN_098916 [Dreissena polymorpha]|uniref:Uncharacterized protein n=1 Tax=Dreissena polymorpha TaxID=45954 RepID=A0A9D4LDY6_DREPO|nr:hypothetical protein DPMN_098916 [Dreissena polymorpha]
MDVSMEKSKIVVNSTTNTSEDITMDCEKLEEVTSFVLGRNPVQGWDLLPLKSE